MSDTDTEHTGIEKRTVLKPNPAFRIGGRMKNKIRTFKMKKAYVVVCSVVILAFYAAAVAGIVYLANGGIRNYAAFAALIPILFLVPGMLTFFAAVNFSSYFVFYYDAFEYHKMRKSVVIQAKNIRYHFYRDGVLTVFFVKDTLADSARSILKKTPVRDNSSEHSLSLPEDKVLFKCSFGAMGLIEGADKIVQWFNENVPALPDGQAFEDLVELNKKYNIEEDKRAAVAGSVLAKAEKIADFLNNAALLIALWVAFYPRPFLVSVGVALLCPLVLLLVLHRSDGWIRFDKKGNSIYPCVCLVLIAPAMGLGWRMLFFFEFCTMVNVRRFLLCSLIFYAVYLVLFLVSQKEFSFKKRYTYGALALYSFYFFGYALAAVSAVNCVFDRSEPAPTVIEKDGKEITVGMQKGLIGIAWYYEDGE